MRPAELVPVPHAGSRRLGRLRAMGDGFALRAGDAQPAVTFLLLAVVGTFGFNFNVLLPLEATRCCTLARRSSVC